MRFEFSIIRRRGPAALAFAFAAAVAAAEAPRDVVELDPVTVSTATRAERRQDQLPLRTERLAPDLFRSAGARDLAAALDYLPGLRSEANCQNCGASELKLLGLGSGYHRLLFDGQPLFSGLASVYGIEHIPTAFIGQIEVVKGGASSLYGPGAIAGVVNIRPRQPVVPQQRFDLALESVHGQPFASASFLRDWTSPGGDLALSVYGQSNDNEAVDLNDDGFTDITEKRFATLGAHGWLYPTRQGKLSLNYAYSGERRRGGDSLSLPPHHAQIAEQLVHRWHRGGATWESDFGDLHYRLSASASHVERDSYYGGVGPTPLPGQTGFDPARYRDALEASRLLYGYSDTTRYYVDAFFSQSIGKHVLSWGAQFQSDDVFDEKRDPLGHPLATDGSRAAFSGQDPIADGRFSNLGLYLQDEWNPMPATSVVAGLRADKHSELERWIASPRLALRQDLGDAWIWRASVATGFRAPELFDEDLHIEILDDPTRTRNVPGLREENAVSYATGFVWTPSSGTQGLRVEGELFRAEINDTFHVPDIVFTGADGIAYKQRRNASGSSVQGFELNLACPLSPRWNLQAGLARVDARFDAPQEVLPGVLEQRYVEAPEWTGSLQLNYRNERFVDLFLGLVYTGSMIAAREAEGRLNPSTPDFVVVDLSATKHFDLNLAGHQRHLDLTIGVKNLFDQRQPDLPSGPERDVTYLYGPRFPRSVFLQTSLQW